MKLPSPLVAILMLAASLAAAQTQAPSDPSADALRSAQTVSVPQALEKLRDDAATDPGAAEVLKAVSEPTELAALVARLTPIDADGSLRAELDRLTKTSAGSAPTPTPGLVGPNLAKARKAADSITDKDFDGAHHDADDDPEGFSQQVELNAGQMSAGRLRAPMFDVRAGLGYKNGPWDSDFAVEGLVAPNGGHAPGVYTLETGVSRRIGDTKNSVFLEGNLERDDLLGVRLSQSLRAGLSRDFIDSARQALTLAVAVGPNIEGTAAGTDHFISPSASLDYTLHLNPFWSVVQKVETEFNASDWHDIELSSVTSLVWKVSKKLSVEAAYALKSRTEQVPGYAQSRSSPMIKLHLDF